MKEKCPVCQTECEEDATACSVCGFTYELGINRKSAVREDLDDWKKAVLMYREKWDVQKQKEAKLQAELEAAKKSAPSPRQVAPPQYIPQTQPTPSIAPAPRREWNTGLAFTLVGISAITGGIIGINILNIIGVNFNDIPGVFGSGSIKEVGLNYIGGFFGFAGCSIGIFITVPILYLIYTILSIYKDTTDDPWKMGMGWLLFMSIFIGIGGGFVGGIGLLIFGLSSQWPSVISSVFGGAIFCVIGWIIIRKRL